MQIDTCGRGRGRYENGGREHNGSLHYYSDVIMGAIASPLFTETFIREQIKENIKAPRHWPLWGEFTGDRWIPRQMASNAENDSIWWRHHDLEFCSDASMTRLLSRPCDAAIKQRKAALRREIPKRRIC